MKTRRPRNVSEDLLTNTKRNKRSKKTTKNGRRESSLPIPIDLIMEIFSRLPAKSIARFRCVSKPWASILGRSNFTELFVTRSSARPQLLLACKTNLKLLIFSSTQPQNPDNSSSPLVVNYYMKFSFDAYYNNTPVYRPVHGLLCHTNIRYSKGKEETLPVICNLSTGQSLLLPKVKTSRYDHDVFTMLGYDPIDKQFKLLSMTSSDGVHRVFKEHQVLSLGSPRNHSWRMIKCCRSHYSSNEGICIEGVLYYIASKSFPLKDSMVVCFDVRFEKFRFIRVAETFLGCDRTLINYNADTLHGCERKLINYNGKLGLLGFEWSSRSIELCVFEDVQKHEWSKHTYVLPHLWQNIVGNTLLYIVGMTKTNEIVFATGRNTMPFCVFYYNIERKTVIRIPIQGTEAFKDNRVYIFLDHVEDLKLM